MNSTKMPAVEESDTKASRFHYRRRGMKRFVNKRNLLIVSVVLGTIFILSILFFVVKIDSLIFPSELKGKVTATNAGAIGDARVCIKSKCASTDSNGEFTLKNLKRGSYKLEIHREGFKTKTEKVELKRGKNTKSFSIDYVNTGSVVGSVSSKEALNVEGMFVSVGETRASVNPDGSFELKLVEVGEQILIIQTPFYKDLSVQISLTEKGFDVGKVQLSPAGDVGFKTVDWLTSDDVAVDNITADKQLVFDKAGSEVILKDLEIGKDVAFEVVKQGYNNSSQEVKGVVAGWNKLNDVQMVKAGKIVYVSNRMGNQNIYMANINGSDEKMLTDNKGDSYAPYLSTDLKSVQFLSKRDKVKSAKNNSIIPLLYSVDTTTKKITKVSVNDYKDNDGDIGNYNLEAGKRIFDRDGANSAKELLVGDVAGASSQKIIDINGYYNSMIVSNSGNSVMYVADYYNNDDMDAIYLYNLVNSKSTKIFENTSDKYGYPLSISSDGKFGLINIYEDENNDLILRDFTKAKSTKLTKNSAFESEAMFTPDSKSVSYISDRDGKSDVYMVPLNGKDEVKLTNNGKVSGYFWMGNLLFFTSDQVMYVVDPNKTESVKEVTKNVFISNYYYAG